MIDSPLNTFEPTARVPPLIHPRLVDRVERSLRKRLNTDIRAHLERYAARAQSEEDFVNAAGRLLLDMKVRQQWLASWASRIHHESSDTSPAPLDEPPREPSSNGLSDSLTGARPDWIEETDWQQLRDAFTQELGPVAPVWMDDEAAHVQSPSQLRERLFGRLETDEQRANFLRNTRPTA
jgi:hypothetical protein